MTNRASPSAAQNAWLDTTLADLQRQIDDLGDQIDILAGQIHTLARQVRSHASTPVNCTAGGRQSPATTSPQEASDGQP